MDGDSPSYVDDKLFIGANTDIGVVIYVLNGNWVTLLGYEWVTGSVYIVVNTNCSWWRRIVRWCLYWYCS